MAIDIFRVGLAGKFQNAICEEHDDENKIIMIYYFLNCVLYILMFYNQCVYFKIENPSRIGPHFSMHSAKCGTYCGCILVNLLFWPFI